jgi:hypothetical protein
MEIQECLTSGENILDQIEISQGFIEKIITAGTARVIFYATEKRLIKYKKRFRSERVSDLAYSNITAVNIQSEWHPKWIIIGFVMTIFDYSLIQKYFTVPKIILDLLRDYLHDLTGSIIFIMGILIGIIGIFLIAIGIRKRWNYQFLSPGLDEEWEINSTSQEVATEFIKTVRNHLK